MHAYTRNLGRTMMFGRKRRKTIGISVCAFVIRRRLPNQKGSMNPVNPIHRFLKKSDLIISLVSAVPDDQLNSDDPTP